MSAIAGISNFTGRPVVQELLDRMVDNAAPWPADDRGTWISDTVGLGHRMLHTTPESLHEKLPFYDGRRFTITADARIDNRQDLCDKLALGKGDIDRLSDSELILLAYKKWGEDCPKHLTGDFAFAIWDESLHKFFCARDPMGIRPFFYHCSDRLFAFASSIEPLLEHPEIPQRLNEFRLACFLTRNFDDCINTFYKDIVRLPGSHCMVAEHGQCRKWRYWEFDAEREIRLSSDAEYEEAFREIFFEAVRCRMRSSFPVGSHLSGGLDSSSIVCAAREILRETSGSPLHTLSAIFPDCAKLDPRIDERPFINAVAGLDNIIHHNVVADQGTPLVDILWSHAEPVPGFNLYMDWLLEQKAREVGVRVLLIGHDGDTTVSHGYELFPELARNLQWIRLYREVRAISSLWERPFMQSFYTLAVRPLVPESWVNAYRRLRGREADGPVLQGVKLKQSFREKVGLDDYIQELHEREKAAGSHSFRQRHLNSITSGLMANATEMVRFVADQAGLEINCPFFDRRMIEFCLALPVEQKMRNGYNRSVMRGAMKDFLPPLIRDRFKKGCLTVNFTRGIHDQAEKIIRDALGSARFLTNEYIELDDLEKTWYETKKESLLTDDTVMNIFLATLSILWLRQKVK